ncbi:MAG: Gfo/Idh/MocA family oxidoreductase [Inhella sp.]
MTAALRLGILGAARIAHEFARGVAASPAIELVAIAARDPARAQAFAAAHGVAKVAPDYEALLADPGIEAVYIPLSNDLHQPWALRALAAGKHVLCEKPLTLGAAQVRELQAAARQAGRVLMEAFPYRFQPQTLELLRRVRAGALGPLRHVAGEFGVPLDLPGNYRYDPACGGGALWDLGVYPLSLMRALAGRQPLRVQALAHEQGGVDHGLAASLLWADGLTATLACRFDSSPHRQVRIHGARAGLSCGFYNHVSADRAWIEVIDQGDYLGRRESVPPGDGFRLEAEAFAARVRGVPADPLWPTEAETHDTIALVEALLRSVREGRAVELAAC